MLAELLHRNVHGLGSSNNKRVNCIYSFSVYQNIVRFYNDKITYAYVTKNIINTAHMTIKIICNSKVIKRQNINENVFVLPKCG